MVKDIIDIALAFVQIATLIALIIYVKKTWDMAVSTEKSAKVSENTLQEMKEARDQEIAPHIVVYFDYEKHIIDLVVKNIGKTSGKNVKFEFNPRLVNSSGEEIGNISLIKDGIGSIPPGYEIRTFFDTSFQYLSNEELPLCYNVKITYFGGLNGNKRVREEIMDLYAIKDLGFINEKGLDELVKETETLVKNSKDVSYNLEKIRERLDRGIWIKNSGFLNYNLESKPENWKLEVLSKIMEFKILWEFSYSGDKRKLVNPFLTEFQGMILVMSNQILEISSRCPDIDSELKDRLVKIQVKLLDLGNFRFSLGSRSINSFDSLGNETRDLVNELINWIKNNNELN
jgi:hypothetical protein